MPYQQVSDHRFLLRRIECALLGGDPRRARTAPLAIGCLLAAVVVAVDTFFPALRPRVMPDQALIVMGQESGALYVRVGQVWHPVLNLASARLIAATDSNPRPVPEAALAHTKRGPLLGIPGAPQHLGPVLPGEETGWAICDGEKDAPTTVVIGSIDESRVHRLSAEQAVAVTADAGSSVYLLHRGQRSAVDVGDPAVLRALRWENYQPHTVSPALLRAIPEAPPIAVPHIPGIGSRGPAGFSVGSVLRISRGDGDEYYVVLAAGVQRVGQVAADLLRFSDSEGAANVVTVAPNVIRSAQIVNTLPVSGFPDRPPDPLAGKQTMVCASWAATHTMVLAGDLPIPAGTAPVTLVQADGRGPAVDAVYLPAGYSAYVRSGSLSGAPDGSRYLITDTGVRFAVHDDQAAHDLGLPAAAIPAPWPILAELPAGPELSRQQASVLRDTLLPGPR